MDRIFKALQNINMADDWWRHLVAIFDPKILK